MRWRAPFRGPLPLRDGVVHAAHLHLPHRGGVLPLLHRHEAPPPRRSRHASPNPWNPFPHAVRLPRSPKYENPRPEGLDLAVKWKTVILTEKDCEMKYHENTATGQ